MAFISLAPQPGPRPAEICFICGERAVADAVLNTAFYVPLGILVGATRLPFLLGVIAAGLLSVSVEGLQLMIPGRFPSPLDILSNMAGATLGAVTARTASWWMFPSAGAADALATVSSGLFLLGTLATGWLTAPDLPPGTYVGQWVPTLGRYEPYSGSVRQVRVGPRSLPSTTLRNSDEIRALLLAGEPLRVSAIAGDRPSSLSPIFGLVRQFRDQLILVGARGEDLVVRIRHRGADWLLNRPSYYAHGLIADVDVGSDLYIEARLCGRRTCVSVNQRPEYPLALTIGEAWSLLADPPSSAGRRSVVSLAWLALLAFPGGFWLRRGLRPLVGPILILTAAATAPAFGSLAPTPPAQWVAIVIGLGVGIGARRLLHASGAAPRSAHRSVSASPRAGGDDLRRSSARFQA